MKATPSSNIQSVQYDRKEWMHTNQLDHSFSDGIEIENLQNVNKALLMEEVQNIYVPFVHNLHSYLISAHRKPFILGITGSVSVGKSTFSQILKALLSQWPEHQNVTLVNTDGFLYPNAILEERGIMNKKGFPESYNTPCLLKFLSDIKSGNLGIKAPRYSHKLYDVVPNEYFYIPSQTDILILEGLHLLRNYTDDAQDGSEYNISDFLDLSIYVDADETDLFNWFLTRFLNFRDAAVNNSGSYFYPFTKMSDEKALAIAKNTWQTINSKNLHENILPTRERADIILHKGANHRIDYIKIAHCPPCAISGL